MDPCPLHKQKDQMGGICEPLVKPGSPRNWYKSVIILLLRNIVHRADQEGRGLTDKTIH